MIAVAYLVVGLVLVGERIHLQRRRRKFRRHAVVRFDRGQVVLTDAALEARLSALGPYETSASDGRVEFRWTKPVGVAPGIAPLEVLFSVSPDNIGPDDHTFDLWQSFVAGQRDHWADFERELLQLYRAIDFESGSEPQPGAAQISDQAVLAQVRSVTIHLDQDGIGDEGMHNMSAGFDIAWDDEHGFALGFNLSRGKFDEVQR